MCPKVEIQANVGVSKQEMVGILHHRNDAQHAGIVGHPSIINYMLSVNKINNDMPYVL